MRVVSGDRVRHKVGAPGNHGTVLRTVPGSLPRTVVIEWDAEPGIERHAYTLSLETVTPLEDLAALGKKNPKCKVSVGSRVSTFPQYNVFGKKVYGTVTYVGRGIHAEFVSIILDTGEHYDRHASDVELLNPLEELAALGKTTRNPKSPNLQNVPRGGLKAAPFELGDRVRCRNYSPDSFGTVRGFSGSMKGWIGVVFDLRPLEPGQPLEAVHESDLEHVSPLEELAALGKTAKKNPAVVPGNRVRVENRPLRGTVVRVEDGWAVVQIDSGEEAWFSPQQLVVLSPLEELARLDRKPRDSGKLKPRGRGNPKPLGLSVGTRVKVERFFGFEPGTVAQIFTSGLYSVELDSGVRQLYPENMLTPISPIEELALLSATEKKAKKNPENTFRIGERVRRTSGPWKRRVGRITAEGLIERAVTGNYLVAHVLFDGALYSVVIPHRDLQSVSPLEELALVKTEANKNPSPSPLLSGDRVNSGGKFGTVVRDEYLSKSFGVRTVVVLFDGDLRHTFLHVRDVERTHPLDDLASTAKKNPNFEAGDRVLCRNHPIIERVGTVVEVHERWSYVDIDDSELFGKGGLTQVFLHELRHINPLEELASVSVRSKKNPADRPPLGSTVKITKGPYAGRVGEVVTVRTPFTAWQIRVPNGEVWNVQDTEGLEALTPLEELALLGAEIRKKGRR